MAGNIKSKNIYVENDYENIILVDPNKVVLPNGQVEERLVDHEDLVFYANLEAKVLPRTKLAVGSDLDDSVINTSVASLGEPGLQEINFLSPRGKLAMDTSWSDQQTGKGAREGKGANQTQEYIVGQQPNQKIVRKTINAEDTQGLGITNIRIQNNAAYIPQVTIEMIDVQGRTLFEQGEQSPYSAFFQLPYPIFYLTVKGYYGKAVRYELMMKKFNARFDPNDGNYRITVELIGRTSAILEDINVQHLFTAPRMFGKQITSNEGSTATSAQQEQAQSGNVNSTTEVTIENTTRGRQVLGEVYSLYKSKGLLSDDFEELTLSEFVYRIESLERYINEQFGPQELEVLNDIKIYREDLEKFRKEIFSSVTGAFFNDYIDGSLPIVESKDKGNGYVYYPLKPAIKNSSQETQKANTKLEQIIIKYKEKLENNTTFGLNGSYTLENPDNGKKETVNSQINFLIDVNKIKKTIDKNKVDYRKTFVLRKGKEPTDVELQTFKATLETELNLQIQVLVNGNLETEVQPYYVFGDSFDESNFPTNSFLSLLDKMERIFNKNSQNIETNLSRTLARKITRPASEGGLGFNPTIRNTMGVICANADAFLRLMDETHTKAYDQRANPIRLTSIIDPEKNFGTDTKDSLQKVTVDGKLSEDSIVYPWPQYFETEIDQNGNASYVIKYPGDPKSLTKTKGYLTDIWPEIQFVEEYLKGSVQKEIQQSPTGLANPALENEYIGVAAVEFPNSIEPYENLTETNFLYEVLERSILSSNYTKLFRPSSGSDEIYDLLGDFEYHNISEAVKKSTSLTIKLKNFAFTYPTFLSELRQQSVSGEGELWTQYSQGNFVTPYIKNYVDNPVQIYDISVFENTPEVTNGSTSTENIEEYLNKTTSNEYTTYDVYPFTNLSWEKQNLANGSKVNSTTESNNTTKTLVFNENKKTIASFKIEDNTYDKTLFTSIYWRDNTGQNSTQDILNFDNFVQGSTSQGLNQVTREGAKEFYENKKDENLYITESFLNYGNEYGTTGITPTQTTSLLNTPYFANAISESADTLRQRNGGQNVYFTSLGYLLVNSLPLATLKEKYKSFNDDGVETELDYVWSVMSKFSAIHRIPYTWILKYGSIWHRYKTYVEDNVDILDSVWTDYDYVNGYDPVNGLSTTTYDIRNYSGGTTEITQQFNTNLTIPTPTDLSFMNIGLYPKLINDTYYFFTEKEVFTGYTSNDWQQAYDKKMYIGKMNSASITFKTGDIVGQSNRALSVNNFFQYMDLRENTDRIGTAVSDKEFLLLPSVGFLPFNQSKFECSNNNNKMVTEMTGNTSVYNGSVRSLWLSTNYGYFNNDLVKKPTHTEYLKQIFTGDSKQNAFSIESDVQYSSIEEIFSIFDKDTLDKFENEFLNFCKPLSDGVQILSGETSTSTFFNVANASDRKYRNIQSVLSEIFSFSGDFTKTSSSDKDSYKLAISQMDNTVTFMEEFLNYDVVLKLGNVGEFDRRIFGSFVTPNEVTQPIDYGNYVSGTLPGDGSGVTLIDSQINNVTEWDTLETYVGYSTISGLTYSDDGSYITDFFIDNNIDFSVQNIQQLSKIIKIYATQKLSNNSLTATQFNSTIQQLLEDQVTFRQTILNNTFTQLRNKLPNYKESSTTGGISAVDGNQPKLEVYSTLKSFNDKWIAGGNFKTRTLFEDFLFLDRANRDIGDSFTIDVISLKSYLKGKVASFSLMSLIGYILSQNNFIFMALPSYINFYGIQEASKNGVPTVNPDIANSAFGTFLSVDYQDSRPKFLCMYVGKPSEHLDMKENKNSRFKSDVFDLRRGSNNPLLENQTNKIDWSRSNKVVGFNLDFGIRNQNIFKSISLDQNQYKNTSESFQVLSDMANQASGDKVAQQTTSLYNIYRTRSYTCNVSSMGNMMIQPTMYFNLRHVPMFYGPYFITNVSHDINVNGFETNFEGMRQPIFSFPSIDKLVMSVNKNLLKKYETFYRKKRKTQNAENATNQNNPSRTNSPLVPSTSENCNDVTNFSNLAFVDFENTRIPTNEVIDYLKSITSYNRYLRAYSLGASYLINTSNLGSFDCVNNNLFGVTSSASRYVNLTGLTNGQVCIQNNSQTSQVNGQTSSPNVPIFSFENKENSIKFFIEFHINYTTIIDKLIGLSTGITNNDEKIANALTYLYLSTWVQDYGTGKTGSQIKQETDTKITNGTFTQTQFDSIKEKMLNAVVKIP
jgi:hypothetical protein